MKEIYKSYKFRIQPNKTQNASQNIYLEGRKLLSLGTSEYTDGDVKLDEDSNFSTSFTLLKSETLESLAQG